MKNIEKCHKLKIVFTFVFNTSSGTQKKSHIYPAVLNIINEKIKTLK